MKSSHQRIAASIVAVGFAGASMYGMASEIPGSGWIMAAALIAAITACGE